MSFGMSQDTIEEDYIPHSSSLDHFQWLDMVHAALTDHGDILLELLPSGTLMGVSRMHVNCVPVLNRALSGIEKNRYSIPEENGQPRQSRMRFHSVLGQNGFSSATKLCFSIDEKDVPIFHLLMNLVHITQTDARCAVIDSSIDTGDILQLLNKTKYYGLDVLAETIRQRISMRLYGLISCDPVAAFDMAVDLAVAYAENTTEDSWDGGFGSKTFAEFEGHTILSTVIYALRCLDLPFSSIHGPEERLNRLVHMPSLLLLHLAVFAGSILRSSFYAQACIRRRKWLKTKASHPSHQMIELWDKVLLEADWMPNESSSSSMEVQTHLIRAWSEMKLNGSASERKVRFFQRSYSEPPITTSVSSSGEMDIEERRSRSKSCHTDKMIISETSSQPAKQVSILCDKTFHFSEGGSNSSGGDVHASPSVTPLAMPQMTPQTVRTAVEWIDHRDRHGGSLGIMLDCVTEETGGSFYRVAMAWAPDTFGTQTKTYPKISGQVSLNIPHEIHRNKLTCRERRLADFKLHRDLRYLPFKFYHQPMNESMAPIVPLSIVGYLSSIAT